MVGLLRCGGIDGRFITTSLLVHPCCLCVFDDLCNPGIIFYNSVMAVFVIKTNKITTFKDCINAK